MKISYNWLRKYIQSDLSAEKTAEVLTAIGLEVEAFEKIETIKGGLEGLVVGEVLTCEKHPDADKLNVTTVDYGDGAVQIVCGAPNVAKGQKVIVATVGATLYPTDAEEPFKIKKSKIRGVDSLGMLCAEDEIGLGVGHDGIMVLDKDTKVGTAAREYFKIEDDYVFEIGLTPNRIDAASHIGVARDLAAYISSQGSKISVTLPDVSSFKVDNHSRQIAIDVVSKDAAPRYMGLTISNITAKPSPEWLQNSLRAIGINPKNNIVDITNFILHELGQPLHAFDADKIEGDRVVVKCCDEGTKFVTLDSVERSLSSEDLMICNSARPMCIAGVFGGVDSGVSDATTNIFIESAYFNPVSIRKSAKRHGLSTDASFRYERGTDPVMPEYALYRAAMLIKELAGGDISGNVIDVLNMEILGFDVEISIDRVERLIGKKIGKEIIIKIVEGLDMKIVKNDGDLLLLNVPSYRVDVKREVDVVEDILRIYGYNNIEIPQAVHSTLSYEPKYSKTSVAEVISQMLSSVGFNEIMSNSLTKSEYYEGSECYPLEKCVKILNPLSGDLNVMRQTLIYNSLEALMLNTNRKRTNVKFYEVGNCYNYIASQADKGGLAPYRETFTLSMLVSGNDRVQSWMGGAEKSSFFTLKHYVQMLLRKLGLDFESGVMEGIQNEIYSDGISLKLRGKHLLNMGVVSKKVRDKFDLKNDIYYLELNIDTLLAMVKNVKIAVKELSKFPEVKRDLALMVDEKISFSMLKEVAQKTEKKLLKSVTLFDVYQGDKLPQGKKSYALNFVLENTSKTLIDAEIDQVMNNLIFQFEKNCGAVVRK